MTYEVTNSLRSKSTVRIVGNTAVTITLSSLAKDDREIVSAAAIAQASSVSNGIWRIYRGNDTSGVLLLELPNNSNFIFYEYDATLANTATANIHVTNSGTAGTMIMQLAKTATYTTDMGKV
jgi:hypothetical protein